MTFYPDIDALRDAAAGVDDPQRLDGRVVASALRGEVRRAVELLKERDIRPKLSVVLVGDDPASKIYVRHKVRACDEVGIVSERHELPADVTPREYHAVLRDLAADESVYGVLPQFPLPEQLEETDAIDQIPPGKDVDGFHPVNLGMLLSWRGELEPCTPRGIITMFRAYRINPRGMHAVVVGRSMVVGRPMAQMLVRADATTTVCHRFTEDLSAYVRGADLVVVATGVPELVEGAWIRPGAVVVDVGITRMGDGTLCGDVEYDAARERASKITPVPGGVGPMTVATLMENTVRAACARHRLAIDREGIRAVDEPRD